MATGIVSACVRSARRAQLVLTAVESVVLGASAAVVTLAAVVAGGSSAADPQAIVAAAITGALAAAAWTIERCPSVDVVARAMDRRFHLAGAVLTALEAEAHGAASALPATLSRRVAPAISTAAFARHSLRSSAVLLAAPFVALTLWSLATDVEQAVRGARAAASTQDLASQATRLAARPGMSEQVVDRLRALAASADELRADPALSAAERGARELELARQFEELRRLALDAAVTPGASEGTMASPGARSERAPDAAMQNVKPPPPQPDSGSSPAVAEGGSVPGPEQGVVASRWWPQRYDAVVERWIEARRNARDGRSR